MVITPEQLATRKQGIGSSDAKKIVDGDWLELWKDKTGVEEWKPTVQQQFAMDCGSALEPVILNRTAYRFQGTINSKIPTAYIGEGGPGSVMLISHADGYFSNAEESFGVEAKAHGGYKDIDELVEYYMPQLQHHMIVHNEQRWLLAVVFGQFWRFDYQMVVRDQEWCDQYMKMCADFWAHVESGFEPLDDGVKKGAKHIIAKKAVDFTGHNQWAVFADDYILCKESAGLFEEAKAGLKELMPDDASYAHGHGMQIKRAKNGALTIKPEVEKDLDAIANYEEVVKYNDR